MNVYIERIELKKMDGTYIVTKKEEIEAIPRVLYRPRYVSQRKAPRRVPKLHVPLKIFMRFVAVIDFILNTVVR